MRMYETVQDQVLKGWVVRFPDVYSTTRFKEVFYPERLYTEAQVRKVIRHERQCALHKTFGGDEGY